MRKNQSLQITMQCMHVRAKTYNGKDETTNRVIFVFRNRGHKIYMSDFKEALSWPNILQNLNCENNICIAKTRKGIIKCNICMSESTIKTDTRQTKSYNQCYQEMQDDVQRNKPLLIMR